MGEMYLEPRTADLDEFKPDTDELRSVRSGRQKQTSVPSDAADYEDRDALYPCAFTRNPLKTNTSRKIYTIIPLTHVR